MGVGEAEPLRALTAAVDRLVADGVGDGAVDGDVLAGLARQIRRLECVASRGAVGFADADGWRDAGAQSSPVWLAHAVNDHLRIPRRRLARGVEVARMPQVAAAWAAGRLGADHVEVLGKAWRAKIAEVFARDEHLFVQWAATLTFAHFANAVAYWLQAALPDDVEADAAEQREQRNVQLSKTFAGMHLGTITLDPVAGEIVTNELERIETELWEQDWAAAKQRLGRDPSSCELERTPGQRRADALVEMARRCAAAGAGQSARPLFVVHIDRPGLQRICELASRTVVTPGSLLPWISDADLQRVVFAGDGSLAEVGPRNRFFRGRLRRGIKARDLECFHDLCAVPAGKCQIDHIHPYAEGGETTPQNGRAACGLHNRQRNTEAKTTPLFDYLDDESDDGEEAAA